MHITLSRPTFIHCFHPELRTHRQHCPCFRSVHFEFTGAWRSALIDLIEINIFCRQSDLVISQNPPRMLLVHHQADEIMFNDMQL